MRRNSTVLAIAALLVAGAGISMSGVAGGAPGDPQASIVVSFEAQEPESPDCVGPDALRMSRQTTEDAYTYIFTLPSDLCTPIDAKAAAYAMPNNRLWPWPQTLVTVEEFTLSEAGATSVSFAKECDPIQFDVITGATPQQIDPLGAHHGPLLVPATDLGGSNGSAFQYWPPASCNDNTTSTTPDGSTSSVPTSDVPVTVSPETTIATSSEPGGGTTPDGQPTATVGAVTATQSPSSLSIAG